VLAYPDVSKPDFDGHAICMHLHGYQSLASDATIGFTVIHRFHAIESQADVIIFSDDLVLMPGGEIKPLKEFGVRRRQYAVSPRLIVQGAKEAGRRVGLISFEFVGDPGGFAPELHT
jgi:hypothetical protein